MAAPSLTASAKTNSATALVPSQAQQKSRRDAQDDGGFQRECKVQVVVRCRYALIIANTLPNTVCTDLVRLLSFIFSDP